MKPSTTLTFLALFFVVAGFYIYLRPQSGNEPGQSVPEDMKLLELKEGDRVRWIQIQNLEKKKTVTLERNKDIWEIKHPVSYMADSLIASGLASALELSTKVRRLSRSKDQSWEEYGLEKPALKIGVETERKRKRRYLYMGDAAPVGEFVFARWEHEKDYFLLNADLKKAFDHTAYSLRMKKIFRSPLDKVDKIYVKTSAESYEIRMLDGEWYWVEPVVLLGEKVQLQDLDLFFSEIRDLLIKDFLDSENRKKEELGFYPAGSFVKLRTKEGKEEILLLGDEEPLRDAFYGLRKGEDTFLLISKSHFLNFLRKLETIIQRYRTPAAPIIPAAL